MGARKHTSMEAPDVSIGVIKKKSNEVVSSSEVLADVRAFYGYHIYF
jgi:hypothetical protein